jgi:hypothetical protein
MTVETYSLTLPQPLTTFLPALRKFKTTPLVQTVTPKDDDNGGGGGSGGGMQAVVGKNRSSGQLGVPIGQSRSNRQLGIQNNQQSASDVCKRKGIEKLSSKLTFKHLFSNPMLCA